MLQTKKQNLTETNSRMMLLCGVVVLGGALFSDTSFAADDSTNGDPDQPKDKVEAEEDGDAREEPVEFSPWLGGGQEYTGWVDFIMGGAIVNGNKSEFRRRTGINSSVFGGVSDFNWEQFVGDNGLFKTSGRIFGGKDDYDLKLSYDQTDLGYVRFGASQHRHWYDGAGGYDPSTGGWLPLPDQDLSLDRSSVWVEGGLTLPDWPEVSIRYEHRTRDGQKDSTIWGSSSPVVGDRGIAASIQGIDEAQDIVKADVKYTFGKTDTGIGMTYERLNLSNSLDFRRDAGGPTQTYTTQKTGVDSDLFNVHAFSDTRLNEKVSFALGYSYTALDTDVSGNRIVGLAPDPVYDPSLARYPGFVDLDGGSQLRQHVASVNVPYRPAKNVAIVPSVIFESVGRDSISLYTATPIGGSSSRNVTSEEDATDVSGRLEIRYTGFTNLVLYCRGNWNEGNGDLGERQTALATGSLELLRDTDFTRFTQQYTAGVNWYPRRRLNTAVQYYYKNRDNDYDHGVDSTPNTGTIRYPAYLTSQVFATHDVNFRVTWRPLSTVVAVTRFDYQLSTIDTGGNRNQTVQSADIDSQIISQSLTWSPLTSLYFHGNFSYVMNTTHTPANESAPSGVVLESGNDYWNAGLAVGYRLDSRTDLTAGYQYYEANNYADNSSVSQPYGAGFQEHRVTAAVKRRLKENVRLLVGYGYFANNDVTYGGYKDYTAHVVYSSLQWRF